MSCRSELMRFCIVGCIAVLVQFTVYYIGLHFLSHNIAFVIGYIASFVVNYHLTTSFTFRVSKKPTNGIGFAFSHVLNFILQILLLNLFICLGCETSLAPVPVFALSVPTNFLLIKWVMKKCR